MCVCLSVTDVTSLPQRVLWEQGCNVYHNAYAGNEAATYTITRTLGTSLLTVGALAGDIDQL